MLGAGGREAGARRPCLVRQSRVCDLVRGGKSFRDVLVLGLRRPSRPWLGWGVSLIPLPSSVLLASAPAPNSRVVGLSRGAASACAVRGLLKDPGAATGPSSGATAPSSVRAPTPLQRAASTTPRYRPWREFSDYRLMFALRPLGPAVVAGRKDEGPGAAGRPDPVPRTAPSARAPEVALGGTPRAPHGAGRGRRVRVRTSALLFGRVVVISVAAAAQSTLVCVNSETPEQKKRR